MTYCLALNLNEGLVLLADTRTNAGIDNISTFGKLFTWSTPAGARNQRVVSIMTAGSLSITQEIISLLDEEIAANGPNQDGGLETILSAPSMFRVADRVGKLMTSVQAQRGAALQIAGVPAGASMIVSGQCQGERPRLFMVYQAGNFIETTPDTPFLQIGEVKYGKPILDRVITPETTISDAVKAAMLSMDATLRSNLSVGLPLDLAVTRSDSFVWTRRRIEADDPVLRQFSTGWSEHLRAGFQTMPDLPL